MIWRGIDSNGIDEQTDKVILHSFYLFAFVFDIAFWGGSKLSLYTAGLTAPE